MSTANTRPARTYFAATVPKSLPRLPPPTAPLYVQLSGVKGLLSKYKGRESNILASVRQKYNATATPDGPPVGLTTLALVSVLRRQLTLASPKHPGSEEGRAARF